MDIWKLFNDTGNLLWDLYEFISNFLLYEINLFGTTFQIINIIGILAGIGLAAYVVVLIIKLFT